MELHFHVYGYDGCPFCRKAKALLEDEGLSFMYFNAGNTLVERAQFLDERGIQGAERTFPRVYQVNERGDEVLVGGYTELETLLVFRDAA